MYGFCAQEEWIIDERLDRPITPVFMSPKAIKDDIHSISKFHLGHRKKILNSTLVGDHVDGTGDDGGSGVSMDVADIKASLNDCVRSVGRKLRRRYFIR